MTHLEFEPKHIGSETGVLSTQLADKLNPIGGATNYMYMVATMMMVGLLMPPMVCHALSAISGEGHYTNMFLARIMDAPNYRR